MDTVTLVCSGASVPTMRQPRGSYEEEAVTVMYAMRRLCTDAPVRKDDLRVRRINKAGCGQYIPV